MKGIRRALLLLGGLLVSLAAHAQFYQNGNDPARLHWFSIETPTYKIIYPQGADSLARSYGRLLEQFRVGEGRSIGTTPGEGQRGRMPVVLHTENPYANGMVLWAPRRLELYTVPEPYSSDPFPWDVMLTAHEPRHHAQLLAGTKGWMKPLGWIVGQAWAPVAWDLYMERPFGEGDAVVAETGLTHAGRARTADFLNFYRVAWDQGQQRNWFQWRYGSFKRYTPDVYTLGYLSMAGARYRTADPLLAQKMWEQSRRRPWLIAPYNWKKVQGAASVNGAFREAMEAFGQVWQADAAARAPFQPMERITRPERFPVEYSGTEIMNGTVYLIREGYTRSPELVALRDGRVQVLRPFASHASSLYGDENSGRLYWTETLRDVRWELSGSSVVRYLDTRTGRTHSLTGRGKRYYSPLPAPDGSRIAVVEYPYEGGSAVVVLNAGDGAVEARYPAPEGLQFTEPAWLGDTLYAIGVERAGFGLYRLEPDGHWATELAPSVQKVCNLYGEGDALEWISDRDGSNQLYRYYPAQKRLLQLTSARYGLTDTVFGDEQLYSIAETLDGTALFSTPLDSLKPREVAYDQVHRYSIEDTLAAQEASLGPLPNLAEAVPISAPKRYRKAWQGMHLHSWAPAYINADAVLDGSFDLDYESASLGLTGFFQNDLGTLSGQLGYGLHKDPDTDVNWRNSLHAKLSWRGWWPVVEASVDFGDRAARRYTLAHVTDAPTEEDRWGSVVGLRSAPLFSASVKAYIPMIFSKGGWLRGITPQVSVGWSNSVYQQATVSFHRDYYLEGPTALQQVVSVQDGPQQFMLRVSASIRGYAMRPRADSQTYPRWGIGAELGASFRPGLTGVFTPVVYAYAYGYLPGILREQGLRLTGIVQQQLGTGVAVIGDQSVNTVPQGFLGTVGQQLALTEPLQSKFTASYAIPIYAGDLSLGGVAYIRNFLLRPHADASFFRAGNLWSAGADFTAELGRLLFVSFDTSIGVSFSYLGGSWYSQSGQTKPYYVGFLFSIDL